MWKKIEVILRPYQIQSVIEKLSDLKIFFYLEDCKGFGKRFSPVSLYKKNAINSIESLPRTKITLFASQEVLEDIYSLILEKGDDGISGNGKIFIEPILKMIDIESRKIDE